jgi:hypothetical protein
MDTAIAQPIDDHDNCQSSSYLGTLVSGDIGGAPSSDTASHPPI